MWVGDDGSTNYVLLIVGLKECQTNMTIEYIDQGFGFEKSMNSNNNKQEHNVPITFCCNQCPKSMNIFQPGSSYLVKLSPGNILFTLSASFVIITFPILMCFDPFLELIYRLGSSMQRSRSYMAKTLK